MDNTITINKSEYEELKKIRERYDNLMRSNPSIDGNNLNYIKYKLCSRDALQTMSETLAVTCREAYYYRAPYYDTLHRITIKLQEWAK